MMASFDDAHEAVQRASESALRSLVETILVEHEAEHRHHTVTMSGPCSHDCPLMLVERHLMSEPGETLSIEDDAVLKMLAGANFQQGATLTLPSGKTLNGDEASALTAAHAPAVKNLGDKRACANCREFGDNKRKPVTKARRKVGGSYNRAASSRLCNICEECADAVLASAHGPFGARTVWNRWDILSIRRAKQDFEAARTREPDEENEGERQ